MSLLLSPFLPCSSVDESFLSPFHSSTSFPSSHPYEDYTQQILNAPRLRTVELPKLDEEDGICDIQSGDNKGSFVNFKESFEFALCPQPQMNCEKPVYGFCYQEQSCSLLVDLGYNNTAMQSMYSRQVNLAFREAATPPSSPERHYNPLPSLGAHSYLHAPSR